MVNELDFVSYLLELSFAIVKTSNMSLIKEHTINVKPERTPITPFCTQVSGVTPDMVASAGSLKDAVDSLDKIIQTEIVDKQMDFCFVTHGGWALRIQLSREARDKKLELPDYLSQPCMFDLKQEIQRWQVHHPDVHLLTTNIKELCDTFKVSVVRKAGQGNTIAPETTTSNIDIPQTSIGIVKYLTIFKHNDVFVHPINTAADLEQFKKEESKVVHLAGLPNEVTQGELDAWFSSNGLRPATMWMMQSTDQSKPSVSGFVVFLHHDDAIRALLLNGRCLSDRVIEVSPSSERVVEAANTMLGPFPLQAKTRQVRPGDWTCANCAFHNFASRRYCFKCNAENHTGPSIASSASAHVGGGGVSAAPVSYNIGGTHQSNTSSGLPPSASPVTPATATQPYSYSSGPTHHGHGAPHGGSSFSMGDWTCPNSSCNFHNYASRAQCMKCGTYRPSGPGGGGAPPLHHSHPSNTGYNPHHHYNAPRPHHGPNFRPGDWYCPNISCGFQNFASRNSCYKCHTPNPSPSAPQSNYGGPSAAGGGHGSYGYDHGAGGGAPYGGNAYGSGYGNLPPGNMMAPGTGGHGFRAGDWYW
jgi:hypothetical protein